MNGFISRSFEGRVRTQLLEDEVVNCVVDYYNHAGVIYIVEGDLRTRSIGLVIRFRVKPLAHQITPSLVLVI